jgi:hypothetical protein
MKNFDTRVYNVSDFVEWESSKMLEISPRFQRRSVWSDRAKSYLVDTVIRGKPIPKILITQSLSSGRNIRTVVDGQQRLRAILGFVAGDFFISRAHNIEFAGMSFADLPNETRSDFLKYEIGVDMLFDLSYEDILDIFARLNTYSVKLNPQELLNAQYLGYFKQAAYRLGFDNVRFWIDANVVTEKQAARMAEAELASDLLGTLIEGIQSKKSIPMFYRKFDDDENAITAAEKKFRAIMRTLMGVYDADALASTNFSRIHFYHSLFSAFAHSMYDIGLSAPRAKVSSKNFGKLRARLDEISATYDDVTAGIVKPPSKAYMRFIDATRRATTDALSRKIRTEFICNQLAG